MKPVSSAFLLCLAAASAWASQTYVPPPPPKLPAMLSDEQVRRGERLFVDNVYPLERIEIYNYLGSEPCGACHDAETPLKPESLAKRFKNLPATINREIAERMGGEPLPLQSPTMDALVQYLVHRYKLYDYKLSQ